MFIRKYGLVLKRLKEEDIEMVRQKRNSAEVSRFMVYREHITPEMQKAWFKSVDTIEHGYFVIIYNNDPVGLIHGKNNDYVKRTSEGGIFIWNENYIKTVIPSLASVIMNDWTFLLANFKATYAKVLLENKVSLAYNKMMGYVPCEPLSDEKGVQWMILTRESYLENVGPLRLGIKNLTGDGSPLTLAETDFSNDGPEDIERLYKHLPDDIQVKLDPYLKRNS
jgi:RimJ/RimL family protein N-acetyltransferase